MHIASRPIGSQQPPYIIAELGVNHDGDVERAMELTRACAHAGANAIKLQLFDARMLMSRASVLAAYQKHAGESDPIAMLQRLQLSVEQMGPVVQLAHSLRLHAIVTVFSVELVEQAEQLPWDAYKTASPDIVNKPLLDELAKTGKPIIVSTGASTLQEVGRALSWLKSCRGRLGVLQCVSSYPTAMELAELGGIAALQDIFDGPVGYSDHTQAIETGAMAVVGGACVLEKHVTYDRRAAGPDHAASLTPEQFHDYRVLAHRAMQHCFPLADGGGGGIVTPHAGDDTGGHEMVESMREALARMPKTKRVLDIEQDVRRVSRQSVVSVRSLPAGHVLRREDLTVKRPGTGLPAYELEHLVGQRLTRAVEADMPLQSDDVA
ncbi:MAG TPA: N-acetylneuraminate synthase family protein [Phycisphaerales bacterium]|nr:N-acetylneuraminate synthase family protein [Phycisphaerales bacterium]